MVQGNLRLVLSVVQKFASRGENLDDLFQVGCIGLIKAIDNFDPSAERAVFHLRRADDRAARSSATCGTTTPCGSAAPSVTWPTTRCRRGRNCRCGMAASRKYPEIAAQVGAIARRTSPWRWNPPWRPPALYEPVYSDGEDSFAASWTSCGTTPGEESWISDMMFRDTVQGTVTRGSVASSHCATWAARRRPQVAKEIGISQAQVSRLEKGRCARYGSRSPTVKYSKTPAFRVKTERGRFVVLGYKSDLESLVQGFQGGILVLLADQQGDVQVAGRDEHDLDIWHRPGQPVRGRPRRSW